MRFCHVTRDIMSFVEGAEHADIQGNRLASGEQNVYLHT
jgi:hypothetical protein